MKIGGEANEHIYPLQDTRRSPGLVFPRGMNGVIGKREQDPMFQSGQVVMHGLVDHCFGKTERAARPALGNGNEDPSWPRRLAVARIVVRSRTGYHGEPANPFPDDVVQIGNEGDQGFGIGEGKVIGSASPARGKAAGAKTSERAGRRSPPRFEYRSMTLRIPLRKPGQMPWRRQRERSVFRKREKCRQG
jgi:hypothetical protein